MRNAPGSSALVAGLVIVGDVAEGLDEARVRHEAGGAPAAEARQRASHVGVQSRAAFASPASPPMRTPYGGLKQNTPGLHVVAIAAAAAATSSGVSARTSFWPMTIESLVGRAGQAGGAQIADHRRDALLVDVERKDARHRARERDPAPRCGNPANAARWRNGRSGGWRMAAPTARPAASIGIVPPPAIGSTSSSDARVPSRQHDQLRRHRLAQRRRARRRPARRADAARRARCRCRRRCGGCSGVPARRTTKTTSGVSASTSAVHPARRKRLDDRVLDHAAQLQRRRLEVLRRSEIHREAQLRRGRAAGRRRERRQQLLEQRLEPHGRAREQVPRDARRRAVMTGGHPGDARVERIQERRLPLASRLGHADVERRPHDQALQLRLHHAVRAARSGQPKLVAAHPRSISSELR